MLPDFHLHSHFSGDSDAENPSAVLTLSLSIFSAKMRVIYEPKKENCHMLPDFHLHSHFSGDSDAAPEEIILSARQKKVPFLCFTDHFDPDYPSKDVSFDLNLDAYFTGLRRLKALQNSGPEILIGAELGLQPHLGDFFRSRLSGYSFDFLIGSTHLVDRADPYYPSFWEGCDVELGLQPHLGDFFRSRLSGYSFDFLIGSTHLVDRADPYYPSFWEGCDVTASVRRYLETTLENICAFDGFDVYGHLDYIIRYIPSASGRKSYSLSESSDLSELVDEILKLLLDKGKGLEVNTGGFRSGLSQPNPSAGILRRYRELGGEILTVGSDAHSPEQIASHFEETAEFIRSCGFRYITIFQNRKPEFLPV